MLAAPTTGNSFPKHSLQALVTLTLDYLAKPILTIPLVTFNHIWFANMTNTMMYSLWRNGQSTEMNHFKQMTLLSNVSNLIRLHHSEHNCIFVPVISYMAVFLLMQCWLKTLCKTVLSYLCWAENLNYYNESLRLDDRREWNSSNMFQWCSLFFLFSVNVSV